MRNRIAALSFASALCASPLALAQDPDPVYQSPEAPKALTFAFELDGLLRAEWTKGLNTAEKDSRQRLQLRPRLELGFGSVGFGLGAEANLSTDDNHPPVIAIQRDNYKSRDLRLDLAFARVEGGGWLRLEAGRFEMPIGFTEMVWDRDLRPQGGAASVSLKDRGALKRLSLVGLGSFGASTFDDGKARVWSAALEADLGIGEKGTLSLTGAYLAFDDLYEIDQVLRRQNTRGTGLPGLEPLGVFATRFQVADLVGRFRFEGRVRVELVADACWNTEKDADNRGLWLAAVAGSTRSARVRGEYVYAKIDKDATLGVYAADDFLWTTGWEGHKGDLGFRISNRAALHLVGQWQRFKDSPRPADREVWVKRYRIDFRFRS